MKKIIYTVAACLMLSSLFAQDNTKRGSIKKDDGVVRMADGRTYEQHKQEQQSLKEQLRKNEELKIQAKKEQSKKQLNESTQPSKPNK